MPGLLWYLLSTRDFEQWRNNFRDNEEILQYIRRGTHPIPYWEAYLSHVAITKYVLGRVSFARVKMYPDLDYLSSASPAKSESEYPPISKVSDFLYVSMRPVVSLT